jgi:hypothetical protein
MSSSEAGVLARISADAVRYGQEISRRGGEDVARRLYRYNSAPLSPQVSRVLPTSQALEEFLGMSGPDCLRPLVREHWVQVTRWWQPGPWCSFTPRVVTGRVGLEPLVHKLYISPSWEYLGVAVRRCLPVLARAGAPAFKWGAGLAGLLRPDKLVVYFGDRESLERVAGRVLAALAGIPAQGVPFTAEIGGAGLLSRAEDPLPGRAGTPDTGRQSWRQWVSGRLAESLTAAGEVPAGGAEPWQQALDRLRRDGIDPRSWTWHASA